MSTSQVQRQNSVGRINKVSSYPIIKSIYITYWEKAEIAEILHTYTHKQANIS